MAIAFLLNQRRGDRFLIADLELWGDRRLCLILLWLIAI